MKIRIQDNSIRFRVTLREVEDFAKSGRLERRTAVLSGNGPTGEFLYAIIHDPAIAESVIAIEGASISFRMCDADRAQLLAPEEEGVYVRREWKNAEGTPQRFLAFVEKDRPGSTCVKPEAWIYDAPPHGEVETRPIPKRQLST